MRCAWKLYEVLSRFILQVRDHSAVDISTHHPQTALMKATNSGLPELVSRMAQPHQHGLLSRTQ